MMTKEGSGKIVTFMTPGPGVLALGRDHISHIVKMHYSYKNLLLYSKSKIRQTMYVEMMTKEGLYQNKNFHDPRGSGSYAGYSHMCH